MTKQRVRRQFDAALKVYHHRCDVDGHDHRHVHDLPPPPRRRARATTPSSGLFSVLFSRERDVVFQRVDAKDRGAVHLGYGTGRVGYGNCLAAHVGRLAASLRSR